MRLIFLIWLLAASLLMGCSTFSSDKSRKSQDALASVPMISVELHGIDKSLVDSVRAHVSAASKLCHTRPAYLEVLVQQAAGEVAQAMRAFGYYEASARVLLTQRKGDCPTITVDITAGKPVTLETVQIEYLGDAGVDKEFLDGVDDLSIEQGDILHHGRYEAAKQSIESVAIELGYLEGQFVSSQLQVQPSHYLAKVHLVYDSGPRYQAGVIEVQQLPDQLDADLVDRILEYEEGQAYSLTRIARLNRVLGESGYFSRVDVRPRLNNIEDESIPIDIQLVPRDRHAFAAGVGFSTDEGLRTRFNYLNRRLNRRGHRLSLGTEASFIEQNFSAEYRLPRAHPSDEWLSFQAGFRREDTDSFTSTEKQLSVFETKRRPWGFLETHFLELDRQDFDIGGDSDSSVFLIPGVRWTKVQADNILYPRQGYSLDIELRGAADAILSDTNFFSAQLNSRFITPAPFSSRFLARLQLGATTVSEFAALPPAERFFTGGDNTVRGYSFEELGPVDSDGDVVGGTLLGVFSAEYEYPVIERWAIAAFADVGNAFGGDGRSPGVATSVGLGARWHSPVGPIRIDLAYPFDSDDSVVFHLRIGPDL